MPRLSDPQRLAVERFLHDGGGVLVVLGPRVEEQRAFYNSELFRGGQGWLPARLEGVAGELTRPELAAAVETQQLQHPALALFRALPQGDLGDGRFPCWWRVAPAGGGVTVARLTSGDPWLVEKSYQSGRVLLCSVPTDAGWDGNLPKLSAFSVLAHELLFYLAGSRATPPTAGQPLRFRLDGDPFTLPTLHLPGQAQAGPVHGVLEGRFTTAGLSQKEVVAVLQPAGHGKKLGQRTVPRADNAATLTVRFPVTLDGSEQGPLRLKAWPVGSPTALLKLERLYLYYEEVQDPGVYTWRGVDGRSVFAVVPLDPRTGPDALHGRRLPPRCRTGADALSGRTTATGQRGGTDTAAGFVVAVSSGGVGVAMRELWLTRRLTLARTASP